MRIRRNHWQNLMLAAAFGFAATANIQGQETTPTASKGEPNGSVSPAAAVFSLEPGDQLLYDTKGTVAMSGAGQEQNEKMDIQTSITVLEKKGDNLTLYAALSATEETTAGKTINPGPRFTFEMPVSGSTGMAEFEKAGLAGSAFPTFSVETIFSGPKEDGKSSVSVSLPITNAVQEGEAVTRREGDNVISVATVLKDDAPVLERTSTFSTSKKLTSAVETSVSLSLTAQGMPVKFSITDKTNLLSSNKLSSDQLSSLKSDVEAAIPIAAKLRTLSMSSPDVMKSVLSEMEKYVGTHPNGEFSFLFNSLQQQLSSAVSRSSNWEKIKEGEAAPDFTATTIDNKEIKLADFKGKVVLLDFWATWCGPCLMELPNVKKLYSDNKEKGLQVIGISADETVEDLQKLVQQEDLQWPQVFDGGDKPDSIQEKYGVMKYPTTILLDKEGKINAVDLTGEELSEAVTKLLEAK